MAVVYAAMLALGINPFTAGFLLGIAATALLVAGLFVLMRRFETSMAVAASFALFVLAAGCFRVNILGIRADILALALNIWGLVAIARIGQSPRPFSQKLGLVAAWRVHARPADEDHEHLRRGVGGDMARLAAPIPRRRLITRCLGDCQPDSDRGDPVGQRRTRDRNLSIVCRGRREPAAIGSRAARPPQRRQKERSNRSRPLASRRRRFANQSAVAFASGDLPDHHDGRDRGGLRIARNEMEPPGRYDRGVVLIIALQCRRAGPSPALRNFTTAILALGLLIVTLAALACARCHRHMGQLSVRATMRETLADADASSVNGPLLAEDPLLPVNGAATAPLSHRLIHDSHGSDNPAVADKLWQDLRIIISPPSFCTPSRPTPSITIPTMAISAPGSSSTSRRIMAGHVRGSFYVLLPRPHANRRPPGASPPRKSARVSTCASN